MSKSRMRKQEVGGGRSTENRASNAVIHQEVSAWLTRINEVEKEAMGNESSIDAVAKILVDLITQTKAGKIDEEVCIRLVRTKPMAASLNRAKNILLSHR